MNLYKISLPSHRRESSKRLNENERAYSSLENKNSSYAKQMKALQDLHRAVYEIYKNAPNELT